MSPDSLQAISHVAAHWTEILVNGAVGAVAGGLVGWFATVRVQARGSRENRQGVVRKLLAASTSMIGDLRTARQNLHHAEGQDDFETVRAIFQGTEFLLSQDDEDRLAAVVTGGAEQLDQQCYHRWLGVQRRAKEAAAKYGQIRGLLVVPEADADLPHHVTVYRGLLHETISHFEDAFRLTKPYAAPDSRETLKQLLTDGI